MRIILNASHVQTSGSFTSTLHIKRHCPLNGNFLNNMKSRRAIKLKRRIETLHLNNDDLIAFSVTLYCIFIAIYLSTKVTAVTVRLENKREAAQYVLNGTFVSSASKFYSIRTTQFYSIARIVRHSRNLSKLHGIISVERNYLSIRANSRSIPRFDPLYSFFNGSHRERAISVLRSLPVLYAV